ncbi:MAG: carbohydrate ABC transporter permease [Jatrophihabitans sp.]
MDITTSEVDTLTSRRPRRSVSARGREIPLAWLFLLPSLVIFGLFVFYPLGRAAYISTRASDILGNPTVPVGLKNFHRLFTADFAAILERTGIFVIITVIPGIVLPLVLAVPMSQHLPGMKIFRTAFALPFAYSVATAAVAFSYILNPSVSRLNAIIENLGGHGLPWTTSSQWALISVAIVVVWMNTGFNLLVIAAALSGVDETVQEAARLDGATGFRLFRTVTLPLITPSIFFLVVITTLNSLQTFGQLLILTPAGGPDHSTTTLVYSIYNTAFANNASDYGFAAAQGLVLLLVGILLAAIQFGVIERRVHYQ